MEDIQELEESTLTILYRIKHYKDNQNNLFITQIPSFNLTAYGKTKEESIKNVSSMLNKHLESKEGGLN